VTPIPTPVPPTKAPVVAPTAVPPAPTTAPTAAPKPTEAPTSAPVGKVAPIFVTNNATFGKIVTDADGMTLYMYPADKRDPSTSNCYDQCAQRWPPLLAGADGKFEIKSSELDAKLFGTTIRKDGAKQVTFNGWPLYYWVNDKKAGDTLGQGVGDIWWVMTPTGGIITAPANPTITLNLGAGRDGDQSGTATLQAKGNQTVVTLNVKPGAAGVQQPSHIHEGVCPAPGAVKYPLSNVVDGKVTTTLDVKLADLLTGKFSIMVHQSPQDLAKFMACGNVPEGALLTIDKGRDGDQTGATVLVSQGAKTEVSLFVKPNPGVIQPAHVHEGVCPVPGAVKYPLTNVVEGKSKTVIDASLADLLKGNFSAMVHLSDKDLAKWVSCGNVKTSTMLAPTAPMSSAPSDNSGKSGY
jgi:predicted lipoprotein with Yx(FWY)xxD motif